MGDVTKLEERFSRWRVDIIYRAETKRLPVTRQIAEMSELHDLVERGPNWFEIERITLRLTDKYGSDWQAMVTGADPHSAEVVTLESPKGGGRG